MDSAGDTVLELQVHLGDSIVLEDRGIGDVTCGIVRSARRLRLVTGENVRMAADSTMLRMVNLLIALSLGVHLEQLVQRMGLT